MLDCLEMMRMVCAEIMASWNKRGDKPAENVLWQMIDTFHGENCLFQRRYIASANAIYLLLPMQYIFF